MSEVLSGEKRSSILVVDDSPENLTLISALLKDEYKVRVTTTGDEALRIAGSDDPPDLVLLDVVMPGMDGFEVCQRLKNGPRTANIPVIYLTGQMDPEDERRGLELGAVDYITKPVNPPVVRLRVRTHLQLKSARDFLVDKSAYLAQEVARRTREVSATQHATMVALGTLAETRDNDTGNHIRRTAEFMHILADRASGLPRFKGSLPPETVDKLYRSAPLHDIGKVGIPDSILLKPGKLTPAEFDQMKTHTSIGARAIEAAEKWLDGTTTFLHLARQIAISHHEKWDGSGYPVGLVGEDIPLPGRLMAVADVYDALVTRRVYKPAFSHEKAMEIVAEGVGTHFDPDIARVFLALGPRVQEIARKLSDE